MINPMPGDIFAPGQILNNTYEILGVLGRGGTGEVYLARNQVVERQVAIKALNSEFSGNAEYIELMKREEEIRDIIHDAVVRYSECSRSDQGHVFLVMEYVDGVSLNDVMMERRLDEKELLIIAHRVLEGLVEVHKKGIVHRDLSPDNIILRSGAPDRATIIDFGIAKDTSTGARTIVGNDFAGKYEYAAPEQMDGKTVFQSDLYALGAALLAAHRREIPFLGTTPGEIVRRKQEPLDTSGVRPPLKDLIEWLAAPQIGDRPKDAQDALQRLDTQYLKPSGKRTDGAAPRKTGRNSRRGGGLTWLLAPVLAGLAGVGLWMGGFLDEFFTEPLPVANPYSLTASLSEDGSTMLDGHAPDVATQTLFQKRFRDVAGSDAGAGEVTLATGMPSPEWPGHVGDALALAAGLEDWELSVEGTALSLTGLAQNAASKGAITIAIDDWAAGAGFSATSAILAGPRILRAAVVDQAVQPVTTCGPMRQSSPPPEGYGLFETITLTGDLAEAKDIARIETTLAPLIGDRRLRMDAVVLNPDLCAIRAVLPAAPEANLSIALSNGDTGAQNLAGVFTTNENPVVDIRVPATITEGSLWVLVVDNTGKVFHILPNVNDTAHNIADLGVVENGIRRIRVLYSIDEFRADTTRIAMRVTQGNYGKSEIIAILTRSDLFDLRRPRDESVTSVAEALGEAFAVRSDELIGMAARVIDARP